MINQGKGHQDPCDPQTTVLPSCLSARERNNDLHLGADSTSRPFSTFNDPSSLKEASPDPQPEARHYRAPRAWTNSGVASCNSATPQQLRQRHTKQKAWPGFPCPLHQAQKLLMRIYGPEQWKPSVPQPCPSGYLAPCSH